jgi:hypothetical protein
MDQTRRAPRLLRRAPLPLLSVALLLALLFTAHAVLAQPPALPPQDAPWTVPNVRVNTTSAGYTSDPNYAPYAAIAAFSGTSNLVSVWVSRTGAFDDLIFARSTNGGASWFGQTRISTGTVALPAQASPAVALAVTGTQVHVGWVKDETGSHTLYYKRSDSGGVTWPVTDTTIAAGSGPAYNPELAISGGNVYYAWETTGAISLARSTTGGSSWLTPTAVYTTGSDTLWYDLSLAAGPTGTLHLVWDQTTGSSGMDACYSRSINGGVTWSARNCLVQLPSSATHTDPDLAIDPTDGSLHLVYLAEAERFPAVMHIASTNGGITWTTPITVSDPLYSATEPSIVISGSHTLYVAWTNRPHVPVGDISDIYYARSQDDGLTWGIPSQVNDVSTPPQTHPFLAAGNNGPRAIWSDYRSNTQWDIYSAAITGTCQIPLTGIAIGGPDSPDPGITATYTAILTPATGADTPISYNWTPAPGAGQGTASADYNWPTPGPYTITVRASNGCGAVQISRAIEVACTPLLAVFIGGAGAPVTAGDVVTLTATADPPTASPTIVYSWAPAPLTGQGTAMANYRWQAVGSHPVTLTATNCGGAISNTASVIVTDTAFPTWGAMNPTGWISTTQSPALNVQVADAQSGLDVSTGQYQFTANSGISWTNWAAAPVSGGDYTTTSQTLATPAVPFNRESTPAGETRVRFQVRDMAGNLGASPDYTVTIDTLPPVMTPVTITSNRLKSTWINPATDPLTWTATMTWTAATDAGSGLRGYSYLWSVNATDLPPAVISTTALSAATLIPGYGQHWYFHVRAVDNVGNWSSTAVHQGPYWVGNAPSAFLTLDPESAGPGAEVILTGFGFDPQVTVNIGFTSTAGIHWLGSVQTSYDGAFQAAATVPDTATVTISGTASTTHGFIAQGGGKTGTAKFSVTRGMEILILNPNDQVAPGGYAWIKANYANKFGSLVLEWAGADPAGPFPMGGVTTKQASLHVPMSAISGTHTLTVTNRVDGYIVQRNTAEFHVVVPVPPTPLTATVPTIHAAPDHGIRGTIVDVTGVAPSACRYFEISGVTYLDCKDIALTLDLQLTTVPTSTVLKSVVTGDQLIQSTVTINPYTGQFTGTLKLKDEFTATFYNEPWGAYNLCLYSDHQNTYTGWTPPENVPQAAAQGAAPLTLVPQPPPTPVPGIPGESSGGQQTWVTHYFQTVACTPFRVDMPGNYVQPIRIEDTWGNYITRTNSPQIVVHGTNTGYLTGTHPVKVRQTLTQDNPPGQTISINLPEGNYWIDAFACGYVPTTSLQLQNDGRFGFYPTRDINLKPNGGLGPSPRGVSTDFSTALDSSGKIGPFLSFQGALYKPSAPPVVPIEIWFNKNVEVIQSVTVALPGGGSIQAVHQGTDPDDSTRDIWTATLDVTNFPAGQVSASVTAFGHYIVPGCPPDNLWGAPWAIPIVMVPAPSWLTRAVANPSVTYDAAERTYSMSGRVGQGVPGWADWTVIPAGVNLNYLGLIENKITAQVEVAETFNILSGEWKATLTKISGESGILCFPGDTGCKQTFPKDSSQLVASPPGGIVKSAADASMPSVYTWGPGLLSSKSYGPWTVYNGVIASYWGIVNVNLSISFGASSQATMQATLLNDLRPNPIHIEPSATLNGNISLWVDILLGVASAGVSGQPYLTVGFPVDIISNTVGYADPTICFGLNGEVWASMLWWEASFGPFEIFKTGSCPGMANNLGIMAATPPPSTLPAPSLASDGYGHLLGTWIHNSSNTPGQNIGVMYYVYWDGATWSDGGPGIADPSFLMSDPEVAFAGPGKALAVFASNNYTVTASKPVTWTDVVSQTSNQEIAYSVFNGLTWTKPVNLTSAVGPSGRVTLAGDPYHNQAMAAWVHDTSNTAGHKEWVIEYAVYNALTGAWPEKGVAASPMYGNVLAEPNLAFNSIGEAALVFVNQKMVSASDTITTPFNDNVHRTVSAFKWSPSKQSWTSMMLSIPNGALMPSVAFDLNDKPIVAYSLYDKDKGGGPTGIGNNNLLGYAVLTGTKWITNTVGSVRGVERPRVIPLKADLAVILFRGFGAVNTPAFSGVPMAVTVNPLKPSQLPSKPGKLASSAGWMYAGTNTGGSGQAGQLVTLGVHNLVPLAAAATMSGASMVPAMSAAGGMVPFAGAAADDVMLMNIPVQADLAITATDIEVGNTVPVSGTSVPITVTVRNLGLAATSLSADLKVYQDEGSAGEQLVWSGSQTPAEMLFMDEYTFTLNWPAVSGVHKLTAHVYPSLAEDLDGENNKASFMVGSPAPPTGLTVSVYSAGPVAGLSWTVSAGTAISGYLVYRGVGTDTLKYVGQSAGPSYMDQGVSVGTHYWYAVSSFTDVGVESAKSAEVSVMVPAGVYLPLVMRGAQ